jgi:hypothetical protein
VAGNVAKSAEEELRPLDEVLAGVEQPKIMKIKKEEKR